MRLNEISFLVLDEADEMLNSFKDAIIEIIKQSSKQKRTTTLKFKHNIF